MSAKYLRVGAARGLGHRQECLCYWKATARALFPDQSRAVRASQGLAFCGLMLGRPSIVLDYCHRADGR